MPRGTRRSLLAACLFLLAGCHSHRKPVIAVIPETTAQELWESEHAGVEAAAQPLKWQVYWNAPSREDDITRQMQLVDHAIASHVAGLILSPDHSIALLSLVHSAIAHGIPTVILGSRLGTSSSAKLNFVLNDDVADGRLAAERAGLYLKSGDSVAVLGVDPYILGSVDRADAVEMTLHGRNPGVNVIEKKYTSFNFAEVEEIAEDTIRSTKTLRVIISLNVNETRGAYQALLDTGKVGSIRLIGCDQDLDLMSHLRSGGIDALVAQNTRRMGQEAVKRIQLQMAGNADTASNIVIEPLLVTHDNMDSEPVQQVLDMNWTNQ